MIRIPGMRLSEPEADALALKAHLAAATLDTADGLNAYTDIVCKCSIAMDYTKSIDRHARAVLSTATQMLDEIMRTGRITDRQEEYLGKVAGFVDDWLANGVITHAGLRFAKHVMRWINRKCLQKEQS